MFCLWFRVQGLGFRVLGSGFGLRVCGLRLGKWQSIALQALEIAGLLVLIVGLFLNQTSN